VIQGITCPRCRFRGPDTAWREYSCPQCGAAHLALARRESAEPDWVTWSDERIRDALVEERKREESRWRLVLAE